MANQVNNNVIRVDTDGVVYNGYAVILASHIKVGAAVGSWTIRDGGASGKILFEFGQVAINTSDGMGGIRKIANTNIYVTKTNALDIVFIDLE